MIWPGACCFKGSTSFLSSIWADRQTLGRGRGENQWWSDEGSLTFTIALDPAAHGLRIDQEPRLALMTAVAVIEAIGALGLTDPGIGIRWPNDIEVNGRKLGGILPERVETRQGHRLLIGIGLNVLTRIDQAPPDVQRMATSLSALQLQPLEPSFLAGFLAAILTQFERALYRMAADDPGLAQAMGSTEPAARSGRSRCTRPKGHQRESPRNRCARSAGRARRPANASPVRWASPARSLRRRSMTWCVAKVFSCLVSVVCRSFPLAPVIVQRGLPRGP